MVGTPRDFGMIQLNVTVYPEHTKIIEKILKKEYSKPIAHKSASEIVRRAIEHYAMFLGVIIDWREEYNRRIDRLENQLKEAGDA